MLTPLLRRIDLVIQSGSSRSVGAATPSVAVAIPSPWAWPPRFSLTEMSQCDC